MELNTIEYKLINLHRAEKTGSQTDKPLNS